MTTQKGYVTDGHSYLVQLPDDNQWGFSLHSDDQSWPGGFGSGLRSWELVDAKQVPPDERERLEWLLSDQG